MIRPDEITFCGRWPDADKAALRDWLESDLAERKEPAMSTALAPRQHEPAETPPAPTPRFSLAEMQAIAKSLADSGLFPDVKTPPQALALMLLCDAEGLHPVTAMRRFHIVKGRPTMKADAMLAEFQRQGGSVAWHVSDDKRCEATFSHPVHQPEGIKIVWTIERARTARLLESDAWKKYPNALLRARSISEGVRMVLPGVSIGIYSTEEAADFDDRPPRAAARLAEPALVEHAPEPEPAPPIRSYSPWVRQAAEMLGITEYQLNNHLCKHFGSTTYDGEVLIPELVPNATNAAKFAAMTDVFASRRDAVREEVRRYRKSEAVRLTNARKARREAEAEAEIPERLPGKGDSYEGPEDDPGGPS